MYNINHALKLFAKTLDRARPRKNLNRVFFRKSGLSKNPPQQILSRYKPELRRVERPRFEFSENEEGIGGYGTAEFFFVVLPQSCAERSEVVNNAGGIPRGTPIEENFTLAVIPHPHRESIPGNAVDALQKRNFVPREMRKYEVTALCFTAKTTSFHKTIPSPKNGLIRIIME